MAETISRRSFLLGTTGVALGAYALTFPTWAFALSETALPIVQGATDESSATFIILHRSAVPLIFEVVGADGQKTTPYLLETWSLPQSVWSTSEIRAQGLRPNVDYRLRIHSQDGALLDERTFRTLDLSRKQSRFAVVSCMSDAYRSEATSMWNLLAKQNCDFVLFVGDTCYADKNHSGTDEASFARRYAETRLLLSWFKQPRLTPSFATWDDHDFGKNNADRTFRFGGFTRELFNRFWGKNEISIRRNGFGVGTEIELFGQRFFMLDDRSFRDPSGTRNGRHLGSEQTAWLLDRVGVSDRPAWLMNGSQFFGGYLGKESFEADHAGDFKDVLQNLSKLPAPVAFVSGDVHFSEIMRIEQSLLGYETFEFTSSSIHSSNTFAGFPGSRNPRRIHFEREHNFLLFDVDTTSGWKVASRCMTKGGDVAFTQDMSIMRG